MRDEAIDLCGQINFTRTDAMPLLELWNALLSFAPYGGIGIKTSLGMGGVAVEPLAPPQKL